MKENKILRSLEKEITNKYLKKYEKYLNNFDNNFIHSTYSKFIKDYNFECRVNPEILFGIYLKKEILTEYTKRINNGDIDLEIEITEDPEYINLSKLVIQKIDKYNLDELKSEDLLIKALESYKGDTTFSIHIVRVAKQEYSKILSELGINTTKLDEEMQAKMPDEYYDDEYYDEDEETQISSEIEEEHFEEDEYYDDEYFEEENQVSSAVVDEPKISEEIVIDNEKVDEFNDDYDEEKVEEQILLESEEYEEELESSEELLEELDEEGNVEEDLQEEKTDEFSDDYDGEKVEEQILSESEEYEEELKSSEELLEELDEEDNVEKDLQEEKIDEEPQELSETEEIQLNEENIELLAERYISNHDVIVKDSNYIDDLVVKFNIINQVEDSVRDYVFLRYGYYKGMILTDNIVSQILNKNPEEINILKCQTLNCLKDEIARGIDMVIESDLYCKTSPYVMKES